MKRRRTTTRRRRVNPTRRRTSLSLSTRPRRRRPNPTRRRRRNPAVKPLIKGAIGVAVGSVATDIVMRMIPFRIGGAYGAIGMKAAVGYGLGVAAEKLGLRNYSEYIALGGFASAASDLLAILTGRFPALLQAAAVPVPAPAPTTSAGVSDAYFDGPSMGEIVSWAGGSNESYYGEGVGDMVLIPN